MAGLDNPQPGEFAVFMRNGRGEVRTIRGVTAKTLVLEPLAHEPKKRQITGTRRYIDTSLVAVLADKGAAIRLVQGLQSAHGKAQRRKAAAALWYRERKAELLESAGE